MSDFRIIHDIALQLRRTIFDALQTTVDIDFSLEGDIERLTLCAPPATRDAGTVASLYLYRFGINPALRGQPVQSDRRDPLLLHRPPLPLQLHYLFTPLLDDEMDNLLLLGRVLQFVHDMPIVSTVNGRPMDDSPTTPRALRLFAEELDIGQLNGLWTAFAVPLRLAVGIRLESLAIDGATLESPAL